eukprot:1596845-Amphidinium_carterae.1
MAATIQDVASWADVASVLTWAGIGGDPEDASTDAGAVLIYLGASPASHWRLLAFLSEDQLRDAMQSWKGKEGDPDWVPAMALQAQMLAACSAARTAIKGPTSSGLSADSIVVKPNTPTVKMGMVISQAMDEE